MRFWPLFLIVFCLSMSHSVYAQVEESDDSEESDDFFNFDEESIDNSDEEFFDLNESEDEDVSDELFGSSNITISEKTDKNVKPVKTYQTYYHRPGNSIIRLGAYYGDAPRSLNIPLSIGTAIVPFRNLEIGLRLVLFNFREFEFMDSLQSATAWDLDKPKVMHLMYSAQLSYHIGELVDLGIPKFNPDKFDPFVSVGIGSNTIMGKVENPEVHTTYASAMRLNYGIGLRYVYSPDLSIFIQGGVSDYGLIHFGVDFKVSDYRF